MAFSEKPGFGLKSQLVPPDLPGSGSCTFATETKSNSGIVITKKMEGKKGNSIFNMSTIMGKDWQVKYQKPF